MYKLRNATNIDVDFFPRHKNIVEQVTDTITGYWFGREVKMVNDQDLYLHLNGFNKGITKKDIQDYRCDRTKDINNRLLEDYLKEATDGYDFDIHFKKVFLEWLLETSSEEASLCVVKSIRKHLEKYPPEITESVNSVYYLPPVCLINIPLSRLFHEKVTKDRKECFFKWLSVCAERVNYIDVLEAVLSCQDVDLVNLLFENNDFKEAVQSDNGCLILDLINLLNESPDLLKSLLRKPNYKTILEWADGNIHNLSFLMDPSNEAFCKAIFESEKKHSSNVSAILKTRLNGLISCETIKQAVVHILSQKNAWDILVELNAEPKEWRISATKSVKTDEEIKQLITSVVTAPKSECTQLLKNFHEYFDSDPDAEKKLISLSKDNLNIRNVCLVIAIKNEMSNLVAGILKSNIKLVCVGSRFGYSPLEMAYYYGSEGLSKIVLSDHQFPEYARAIWQSRMPLGFDREKMSPHQRDLFDGVVSAILSDVNYANQEALGDSSYLYKETDEMEIYRKMQLEKYPYRSLKITNPVLTPTAIDFDHAVEEFLKVFRLQRVIDIFSPETKMKKPLINAFLLHPVIRTYLLRDMSDVERKDNQLLFKSKYEIEVYKGMTISGEGMPLRARLGQHALNSKNTAVFLQQIILDLKNKQSIDSNYSNIIVHYDKNNPIVSLTMPQIARELDNIVKNLSQKEGISYVIFRAHSPLHALATVAIIDNLSKEIRAFLFINSWDNEDYNANKLACLKIVC